MLQKRGSVTLEKCQFMGGEPKDDYNGKSFISQYRRTRDEVIDYVAVS